MSSSSDAASVPRRIIYESIIKVVVSDPPEKRAREIEEGLAYACALLHDEYGWNAERITSAPWRTSSAALSGTTEMTMQKRDAATRRFWTWERENGASKGWACSLRFGRLQIGGTIIRHRYARSSDRWVIHPEVIYDRAS